MNILEPLFFLSRTANLCPESNRDNTRIVMKAYYFDMYNIGYLIEKYRVIFMTAIGILLTLKLYRFWLNWILSVLPNVSNKNSSNLQFAYLRNSGEYLFAVLNIKYDVHSIVRKVFAIIYTNVDLNWKADKCCFSSTKFKPMTHINE